jgi:hypothetical protein
MLLSSVLWGFEQSIFAKRLEDEQYRQKYNIQVTGNNAKEVIPCVPSRDPRIEDIPEKLSAILTRLAGIKSSISSHDKSAQTEFDALCTLLNEIIKGEGCIEKKIKECCSDLSSEVDKLSHSIDKSFNTVIDVLNTIVAQDGQLESNLDNCCSSINSNINNLSSLVESEFATVLNQLSAVRADEATIQKTLENCCSNVDEKLNNLTNVVEADFAIAFDSLNSISVQQTTVQNILENCCATLDSKIDIITETLEVDFALVFEGLNAVSQQAGAIESKLDNCCENVNSRLDNLAFSESTIVSKVDALNDLIVEDFASTFTVLSAQSHCSPIAITQPTIITTPGHYCLANDLSGETALITILGSLANDIMLDLNGHTLNSDAFGIAFDGSFSHKNIEIFNGSIVGGVFGIAINSSSVPHQNIKLRNISIRNSNAVGFFAVSVEDLVIDQVTTFSCGNNLIDSCANVLITNSFFNNNIFDGCNIMSCNNVALMSSFFNDNGSVSDLSTHRGLLMDNVNSFKAVDCSFGNSNTVNTNQQFGVAVTAAIANSSNLAFDGCSFNNNTIDGVVTVTASSGLPNNIVTSVSFEKCIANSNGKAGFHLTNTVLNSAFNNCQASRNILYGYLIDGITPSAIDIQNSFATGNGIAGFEFASGSGLIQANRALNNASCGFDLVLTATTLYSYVGNVAKNNGNNPANRNLTGTDSNYCLNGSATAFVTPGPGPVPYAQLALVPGTSRGSWDNITVQ